MPERKPDNVQLEITLETGSSAMVDNPPAEIKRILDIASEYAQGVAATAVSRAQQISPPHTADLGLMRGLFDLNGNRIGHVTTEVTFPDEEEEAGD